MMYKLIRLFLFLLDAEKAHNVALASLTLVHKIGLSRFISKKSVDDPVEVMGISFKNRVGLAAGLDKNAKYIDALDAAGFGFIEVGTVTPKGQPGNDKPRLFRIKEKEAIINRMGFNNDGVQSLINNVRQRHSNCILGINIGKNLSTAVENANDDYLTCFEEVYNYADYITVNISSPNTPGLRKLQHGDALKHLLTTLKDKQKELSSAGRYVPLAVKIAPDLTDDEVTELAEAFIQTNIDAVIATNTTSSRKGVKGLNNADEQGGLSGKPVLQASTEIVRKLSSKLNGQIPIIAVGGVSSAQDAIDKIEAGASLVQIYSGFIYQGPDLIHEVALALKQHCR